MADLGFLPAVRRLLDKTPQSGQRLLFSATLDKAIDVRQALPEPARHARGRLRAVADLDHGPPRAARGPRAPRADPGRPDQRPRPHGRLTRTKHGAKALTRQLNSNGVPTVELHGNLSQNARTRNMEAFHSGAASTLVATDIAARGIHVDDVALVVHADPPVEHKAHLHRSAVRRAPCAGTVITLMTDDQVRDVRDLTRAAGIKPTTTRITGSVHPLLAQLAPGERVTVPGGLVIEVPGQTQGSGGRRRSQPLARRRWRWPQRLRRPEALRWRSFLDRRRAGQGAVFRWCRWRWWAAAVADAPAPRRAPARRQPQRRVVQRTPLIQASGRCPRRRRGCRPSACLDPGDVLRLGSRA